MNRSKSIFLVVALVCAIFGFSVMPHTSLPVEAQGGACENPVEVVLVLDYSGSVAAEQPNIVAFAQALVAKFVLAPDKARFGVVRYATSSVVLQTLTDDANAVDVAINATPNIGGSTNVLAGFTDTLGVIGAARPDTPRVAVHLTDGLWNTGGDPISVAYQLNAAGTHIFGVNYGSFPDAVERISNQIFNPGGLDNLTSIINALAAATCNATIFVPPLIGDIQTLCATDNRINCAHGDLYGVVYPGVDGSGNPAIDVYCVDASGNGYFSFSVTQADLVGIPPYPPTNTLVKAATNCLIPVEFYVLTTGEYQVNFGPTVTGDVAVTLFTGLDPQNIYWLDFNVYAP